MKKRLMSIVLAIYMLMTMFPVSIFAATTPLKAKPSKTTFVLNGKVVNLPEAYNVNNNNYLQLRAIAVLLNGTAAQFNVGYDGTYAVIETGKPYTGVANPATLMETTDVRKSATGFKLDGRLISFDNAYYIGGYTNYLQLREVASKFSGTASQFDVYYDDAVGRAVIVPGIAYTGQNPPKDNYYDDEVKWLGTTGEYQKTLRAFYDQGVRKVSVNGKYGLANQNGTFVAEPIYDIIEAYYWHEEYNGPNSTNYNMKTESIFVDGYVQAVRSGKMGLLDTNGKEVIPCNYDSVGLPSDGICRITKKSNGRIYLGYWNLEQGKEIVAPNKYVIPENYESIGSPEGDRITGFIMPEIRDGRYAVFFDFYDGYALVPTTKVEKVLQNCESDDRHDFYSTLVYAQIIDKNGKEVLSGGPYSFNITPTILTSYPQAGQYMVYDVISSKKLRMVTDTGGEVVFSTHLESGIVGSKGIVVSAQYHGGIWGSSQLGWYTPGAQIQIIPELSLAITLKCGYDGFKEAAAKSGVINFSNKEVIPFGTVDFLSYNAQNKVFVTEVYKPIYRADGTKIPDTTGRASDFDVVNGYVILGEDSAINGVTNIKTGKSYKNDNLKGTDYSVVSAKETLWVQKGGKWGLVNATGSIILPFEYEEVNDYAWIDDLYPHAFAKKNGKWGIVDTTGKVLLAFNYKSIDSGEDGYINIQDSSGKYGIYSLRAEKVTVSCTFSQRLNGSRFLVDLSGNIEGTVAISTGNSMKALIDLDTGKQITDAYLVMKPGSRGVFWNTNNEVVGPDGKIIFTKAEDVSAYTLVVKDGKVGSINASRLKIGGKLPTTPYDKPTTQLKNPKFYLVAYPEKRIYTIGEGFDTTGLIVHYEDEYGVRSVFENSKLKFITSKTVELTQGRQFTTSGIKTVEIYYNDKKIDTFDVNVISASSSEIFQSGDYYLQILGKYLYPVKASGTYWLELSDKKPDKPFTITLKNYSDDRGPMYTISYDGTYICQPTTKDGAQLQSSNVAHSWRINKYASFITIRDYGNQKLIVNASGEKSANGTKVIVWSSTGSAPEHAKVTAISAK